MDILTAKDRVLKLLKDYPHLRDDDNKLISNIWHSDLYRIGQKPVEMSGYALLQLFANGKLTKPESIRRIRQKLQEEFKELRGQSYKIRQYKEQEETKEQLYTTPELYPGGTP